MTKPPSADKVSRHSLIAMLGQALGDAKAREAVDDYTQRLKLDSSTLSIEEAGRLLELMAGAEGILGTVARFAKARIHLRKRTP